MTLALAALTASQIITIWRVAGLSVRVRELEALTRWYRR